MTALAARPLTDLQQRFVDNILDGLPPVRAAELAGIASPRTHATRYVHNIHVQRAIMEGLTKRLAMEGAPLAYNLLVKVVSDDAVSSRVRVDAAKALLDRAGFVPPKASDPVDATEKDLSKMSRDELKAFVVSRRSGCDAGGGDAVGIFAPFTTRLCGSLRHCDCATRRSSCRTTSLRSSARPRRRARTCELFRDVRRWSGARG